MSKSVIHSLGNTYIADNFVFYENGYTVFRCKDRYIRIPNSKIDFVEEFVE